MADGSTRHPGVTPRQREVLDLLARGYTNGQLAEALGISLDGAKWHVSEVISRLGVDTREEAAEWWRRERGIARRVRDFPRRMSARPAVAWFSVVGVGIAVVLAFAVFLTATQDTDAGSSTGWQRLPDPPIPPRATAVLVWTGEEVLVIGGDTFRCPPFAGCLGPDFAALTDGAAFNPATNRWRRVADAPVPIRYASTAVVRDVVYVLASVREDDFVLKTAFLSYDSRDDRWEELPLPGSEEQHQYLAVTSFGDDVLMYSAWPIPADNAPYRWDADNGGWESLPALPVDFTRQRIVREVGTDLYVFDEVSTHRLHADRAGWDSVDARVQYNGDGGLAEGEWLYTARVPNPHSPSFDGSNPYNFGLAHNFRTGERRPLRGFQVVEEQWYAGIVGTDSSEFVGVLRGGWLYFVEDDEWRRVDGLSGVTGSYAERNAFTPVGRDTFVFGGVLWPPDGPMDGELLHDAWMWRAPD